MRETEIALNRLERVEKLLLAVEAAIGSVGPVIRVVCFPGLHLDEPGPDERGDLVCREAFIRSETGRDAKDGDDLAARISKLPGFGEMKTKILIAVLAKKFGVKPPGWERHAATWHSVADVDSVESMAHARDVKRDMKARAGK